MGVAVLPVPAIRFGLLGPVEAHHESGALAVGGARGQSILAALLLNADRVVSVTQLVDAAWGEHPPSSARIQAQNQVSGLRRMLRGAQPGADLIATIGSGYMIRLAAEQLDVDQFERHLARANQLAETGHRVEAADELASALGLWRGPALDGLGTPYLMAAAQRLEEQRLQAWERRIELDLDLGRHADLIPELTALADAHPYREGVHALLMLALYRSGRQAEALRTYRQIRTVLVDQLGVEPRAQLQQLHEAILRGDEELDRPPPDPDPPAPGDAADRSGPVPRELPTDVSGFTGRAQQLEALDGLVGRGATPGVITAISGTAGVGKTALAVRWAHRVSHRFPDGQLYVNLRGYAAGPPMPPIEALGVLLRSLGLPPERVPVEVDEAATLYRSTLAGRRLLVMLDNARSVDQVRPLLPGTPGCIVLVTSRDRLGGLVAREGAFRLTLDVLTPPEARELLVGILGERRVAAEPEAAAELAGVCAYLPLALRIAAATLLSRPHRRIADQVAGLRNGHGLAELAIDGDEEAAVRVAFDLSYRTVSGDAQRLFRLLGLVPGPDVTADAAAALAGIGPEEAERLLDRLAGAHLIEEHAPNRYMFHDLLRRFARERSEQDDPAEERDVAPRRLFDWYQRRVDVAAAVLFQQVIRLPRAGAVTPEPDPADPGQALAWLDAEWHNLAAAIHHTAGHGPQPVAWYLADGLRGYFARRRHMVEWLATGQAGLAAAEAHGDQYGQGAMHHTLGQAHYCLAQYSKAIDHLTRALHLVEDVWPAGHGSIVGNIGSVYAHLGRLDEAIGATTRATELNRRAGRRQGEAVSINNLAYTYRLQGRLDQALALATRASEGLLGGEPNTMDTLSRTLIDLGRYAEAAEVSERALRASRQVGNRLGEAQASLVYATVHAEAGRLAEALERAEAALALIAEIGDRRVEAEALNVVGTIHCALGDHSRALATHERALAAVRAIAVPHPQAVALIGIADACRHLGRTVDAIEHAGSALRIARAHGFGILVGRALMALAQAHVAAGDRQTATGYARQALASHRDTGHHPGEIQVMRLLEEIGVSPR